MKYRRELDGMRALAIIPVLIFHLNDNWLPGGYLGVDIFFVISGFLITGILIQENQKRTFSFLRFYVKRVMRLFPAMFLMLATVVLVSFFYDSHSEFKFVNQAAISVLVFLSNIFFNIKSDYFNHETVNPLLHTWSLAVEEQYYFFMPLFIFLLFKFKNNLKLLQIGLIVLSSCSLFFFIYDFSASKMDSFFLFTHRFWELGIGSLIALNFNRIKHEIDGKVEVISSMFLGMILFSYLFDPNVYELGYLIYIFVTITSGFLLVSIDKSIIVKGALSFKPLAFIGLISYSLYLWHQPIIIFSKKNDISLIFQLAIIIAISFGSYRFELYFRKLKIQNNKRIFLLYSSATLSVLTVLCLLYSNNGNIYRYTTQEQIILKAKEQSVVELKTTAYDRGHCFLTDKQSVDSFTTNQCLGGTVGNIALIGDSEAAHLYPGLKANGVSQITMAGCRPLLMKNTFTRCKMFYNYIKNDVIQELGKFKAVIISANWNNSYNQNPDEFKYSLSMLLDLLEGVENVYIISDLPNFTMNPYDALIKYNLLPIIGPTYLPVIDNSNVNAILKDMVEDRGHVFIEQKKLCRDNECLFIDGDYLFRDNNHLSDYGSTYLIDSYFKGVKLVP